ncbi:unnamed protein product [Cyprideis torosa]|uniref:RNA helicase n=1 Tax=Cyprideis torosa TaxID=163714 RepID=A0A7R8WM02_9CRUS|nr:unnamed protein product [Cyprideis torosa]CAG0904875.1 unnamed protein product [Cyprideis torosa]
MKTKITELFGIEHPIMQGGMHYVGFAELAAAVSNAGGIGTITGLTQKTPADLANEIAKCRDLTDKPFAVNLTFLPTVMAPDYPGYVKAIIEGGVTVVETAGRNPESVLPHLKDAGIKVIHKCTSVRHALKAQSIGCDAVSVDGFECGGHPGEDDVPNMILLPRAHDELEIPFLASGGMADARSLVASLAMGAEGINMGTRFIATKEAPVHENVKQAILNASELDTRLVMRPLRNTERVMYNSAVQRLLEKEEKLGKDIQFQDIIEEVAGVYPKIMMEGDMEVGAWSCGMVVGLINDIPTCKELVDRIMKDAHQIISERLNSLTDDLLKAVQEKGYDTPSPIQQKAIPVILQGKDVLASAQTGTGKTAGFTLPMLQLLSQEPARKKRPIRALVLAPTRELAAQVLENVKDYSKYLDLRAAVIFGGVNQNPQIDKLRNGVDILIATPGRLLDLQGQGFLSLSQVEILVLDEADRMLDMGFLRDIQKILKLIPEKRQNLLFSATFSKEIKKLASEFMHQEVLVEATPENTTVEAISQKVYRVAIDKKPGLIIKLISEGDWQQVLVFTRTKHGANRLAEKMGKAGISAAAIHGNKSQAARTKALAGFKSNKIRVLVATDIAARGLDIPLLPHVVNFEMPNVPEDYVHRIGRTGRAGAEGEAISLVSADETSFLKSIERLINLKLRVEIEPGFEPDPNASTEPIRPGQRGRGGRNNSRSGGGGKSSFRGDPTASMVCHSLLIEEGDRLLLFDAGIGLHEMQDPIPAYMQELRDEGGFVLDPSQTALQQIEGLGLNPLNVSDIICSHFDVDHIGGLSDFPQAKIHLSQEEYDRFNSGDPRYIPEQITHDAEYVLYSKNDADWMGAPARKLKTSLTAELYLIPLFGHTAGHCGIALKSPSQWIFFTGDAYFFREELSNAQSPYHKLSEAYASFGQSQKIVINDSIFTIIEDSISLDGEEHQQIHVYRGKKKLLSHTLYRSLGDCSIMSVELGKYQVIGQQIIFYSYWAIADRMPSYLTPYGFRKQIYEVDSLGRLQPSDAIIYLEDHTPPELTAPEFYQEDRWTHKGLDFLASPPQNEAEQRILADYIRIIEEIHHARFVFEDEKDALEKEVRAQLKSEIHFHTHDWVEGEIYGRVKK